MEIKCNMMELAFHSSVENGVSSLPIEGDTREEGNGRIITTITTIITITIITIIITTTTIAIGIDRISDSDILSLSL